MLFAFCENAISFEFNPDSAKNVWMSIKERKKQNMMARILLSQNRPANNKKRREYILVNSTYADLLPARVSM